MTIEQYKQYYSNKGCETKAFTLLERVFTEFMKRGIEPQKIGSLSDGGFEDKERYIELETIDKHNGAKEDVSCRISIFEQRGRFMAMRIAEAKVPKAASERVINNRIDKILQAL